MAKRKTTINNAFASAVAPCDVYDEAQVREAISQLGQNPDSDLCCVYCNLTAETWDHVFGLVTNKKFSGYGHRLGNLLPCCKSCNSKKGGKHWKQYLETLNISQEEKAKRIVVIENYLKRYRVDAAYYENCPEYLELQKVKEQIIVLMSKADEIAQRLREHAE